MGRLCWFSLRAGSRNHYGNEELLGVVREDTESQHEREQCDEVGAIAGWKAEDCGARYWTGNGGCDEGVGGAVQVVEEHWTGTEAMII